jgi:hypothetical protein
MSPILAPPSPVTDGMNLLRGFLRRAQELGRGPVPDERDPDQPLLTEWRDVLAALPGVDRVYLAPRFLRSDRDVPSFSLALYADFLAAESEHRLSLCLGRTSRPSLIGVLPDHAEIKSVWVVFLSAYGSGDYDPRELLLISSEAQHAFRRALSEVRSWRADPARSLFEDRALAAPPPDL